MNKIIKYSLWVALLFLISCQDFLEPKSQSEYVPKLVKSLDELLLGEVYMGPGHSDGSFYSVLGIFDDDVATRPDLGDYDDLYEADMAHIKLAFTWSKNMKNEFSGYNTYGEVYKKIVGCNAVLDYVDDVQGSENDKNKVKAQALAFRGYFYFHLVNLYGKPYSFDRNAPGVPLKLNSGLSATGMARNTVGEVYEQIIKDLLEAEHLFSTLPEEERDLQNNRINLPCIQLILSRAYLYMENWQQALAYGKKVIKDHPYEIRDLNSLPLPNRYSGYPDCYTHENPEVIFLFGNQGDVLSLPMKHINVKEATGWGRRRVVCVASTDLINSYAPSDLRKSHYLTWESIFSGEIPVYRVPVSKYEVGFNYNINWGTSNGKWGVAFKVTEAYLNAAEAAALLYKETGKGEYLTQAKDMIDKLRIKRIRDGDFQNTTTTIADDLITLVRSERRRELCFEHHRWFDLRRYGMEKLRHVWYDKEQRPTEFYLEKNDPGYTLQIPNEAFELNPALVQNETRK